MASDELYVVKLTKSLKEGDKNAFAELYNLYKKPLTANLFKLLKSEEQTLDLLQDLFLKIWENKENIDPDKSFRAFIFRVAENMVFDYYRKAARDSKMQAVIMQTSTELYSYIEEEMLIEEHADLLQAALEQMPPQRRKVFTLCKLEGKSYKQIEEIMGIGHKTINSHLYQASRFLKEHFKKKSGLAAFILASIVTRNL
jgi:RNA polymerase sigma-70 factor (family 1)